MLGLRSKVQKSKFCFAACAVTAVKNAVKALEVLGLSGADCSPRKRVSFCLSNPLSDESSVKAFMTFISV